MVPDITGGANLGDGFKAREDITPKILAAIKAMNAKKDANGMMHADDGKFTSGGDSGFNKPDADGASGDKTLDRTRKSGKVKRRKRKLEVSGAEKAVLIESLKNKFKPEMVGKVIDGYTANYKYRVQVNSDIDFGFLSRRRLS